MNNGVNADNDDRNALLSFLPVLRSNQEFYMRQQWTVTNYSFLIFGAIIGIIIKFDQNNRTEMIVSSIVSLLVCAAAALFIHKLQNSVKETRDMVNAIYHRIPELKYIVDNNSGGKAPVSSCLFIVLLILGTIGVLWVIYKKSVMTCF